MSITIIINGSDASSDIDNDSVSFNQGVTKSPSLVSFRIKKSSTKIIPPLGATVILREDGIDLFKGTITERNDDVFDGLMLGYTYSCKDDLHKFDRLLVKKAYNNTTVVDIAQDIVDNFSTGFTLEAPADSPAIDTIRFNYEAPSKAMQALCDAIGWDWFIDASDIVHLFAKGDKTAPFDISDTNGNLIWNSLQFDSDILDLKNIIYVRGGEYLSPISASDARDKYTADGYQLAWPLVLRYDNVQVTVDGVAKTVGIENITDPATVDVLYNYQEKSITFRDDNKPSSGKLVKVFGDAYIPLIVQAQDSASILAYGGREDIKIDTSITSVSEAEMLAQATLDQSKEGSYQGSFKTLKKGLRAGQYITINSTIFGINDSFMISKIVGKMKGNDRFEYTISFLKSGETNFTDIMVGLLGQQRKNIVISDDEVIQRLLQVTDEFSMSDLIVSITKTTAPYYIGTTAVMGFSTVS